jgi:hypothetical protein
MIPFSLNLATEVMTLRDYFAALAMQGMMAADSKFECSVLDIADIAYTQADAMLKERAKDAQ